MSDVAGYDPILFDLDGTVIDSVELIRESHRHAVRTVLRKELPDETLVALVGRPLIDQMRQFSVEHADELLRVYRTWNHSHSDEMLRAYHGIDRLLTKLTAGAKDIKLPQLAGGPILGAEAYTYHAPYFARSAAKWWPMRNGTLALSMRKSATSVIVEYSALISSSARGALTTIPSSTSASRL